MCRPKITVSTDGTGLVSQAGTLLLAESARVTGLGQGLSGALAQWWAPRAVHDPGKILANLAMTLALGGDCLADSAVLRAQPDLAGPVASDPVISRLVAALSAFADHGAGAGGETLAMLLRPGNAGSNTAAEHIEVTRLALAQLPRKPRRRGLVRTDSADDTHDFVKWLAGPSRRLHYSADMTITEDMQQGILALPERSGTPPMTAGARCGPGRGSPS